MPRNTPPSPSRISAGGPLRGKYRTVDSFACLGGGGEEESNAFFSALGVWKGGIVGFFFEDSERWNQKDSHSITVCPMP